MEDKQLDDQLAEFTDRLLEKGQADRPGFSVDNQELRALEETVVCLKEELVHPLPGVAMAARIQARLVSEWRKAQRSRRPFQDRGESWLDKLRNIWLGPGQRRLALGLTTFLVVALVAAWLLIPNVGGNLTGTAGVEGELAPFIIILLLMGLIILIWLALRRR
ncbi:MAG: hypothetical protein JXB15_00390 [Anaerolineales bacterium]|nr:hypothetical protein [Anaerolineales bacterium]